MSVVTQLTILIPNYNRPIELARLLKSVFDAIEYATADNRVKVVLVDDYSDMDLSRALEPYWKRDNFTFKLQAFKCGNAETAFLSALDAVETEYVWLLGNDDLISVDSIKYVLRVLDSTDAGFILLNPQITKTLIKRSFVPIDATAISVFYEKAEDMFMDFGFVTSTTTFPCLIMKVAPVREFHRQHSLFKHATVYSHTFTIFGALRKEAGLFLSTPIVNFTLNERIDEHRKLQKQAPAGIMFYHHTLGLARLIRECAKSSGVTIALLGSAFEDEVNKDNMQVIPTNLSHFLTFFFIEQLCREQIHVQMPIHGFGHLVKSEINEICHVIQQFGDIELWGLCSEAIEVFCWQRMSPRWKIEFLRAAQNRLRQMVREKYKDVAKHLPVNGPKKVATSSFSATPLRGVDSGEYGLVRTYD